MERERTIAVLNLLITINNDRIKGYEIASRKSEEHDLQSLFAQFISTSQKCKDELVSDVYALGGETLEGTKISGKFFRVWMDIKAAFAVKDRKAILNSCAYVEDEAQDTYEYILRNEFEHLSAVQLLKICDQKSLLKANDQHVKALRYAFSVA